MTLFDTIGETYTDTRRADERIVDLLTKFLHLRPGATIADIGAGTGNYSVAMAEAGFRVYAIEPSSVMRRHARLHPAVEWLEGCAEDVPLPDASVDGVISTLAACHYSDTHKALSEMARISFTGSVVIFTFDNDVGKRTWLYEYFPFFWDTFDQSPSPYQLACILGNATASETDIVPFPLPPDLKDNFAAAAWRCPRRYLDERYRANISSFRKADPDAVAQGIDKLADDLAIGVWKNRHGTVSDLAELDAGYRFVFTCREGAPTSSSIGPGGPHR